MSKEIPKHYEFKEYENHVYRRWIEADSFAAIPDERTETYVIMMPLPNVTGALHMGHAMDNAMQDLLTRWHRMEGLNSLWMPGTDHAGIATQAVVEKRLFELEGKTRHDIGREALVERIWAWKDEYQERIIQQLHQMGCSCDWKRARFTMDAVCARAVREAFFRLFRDGLIYRGFRLVNWDCHLQTAVSDDEIIYETVQSHFWHMRYPVIDPQPGEPEYAVVATTRPETMLGDTAVACHPDPAGELDRQHGLLKQKLRTAPKKEVPFLEQEIVRIEQRKTDLLPQLLKFKEMAEQGRKVMLPLLDREMPLILDEWAKPELGSGCVKITPAHDPNDYEVWQRHRDEIGIINILNDDGTLNPNAGPYAGQDRLDARNRVVADLESRGLMQEIEDREIEIGHSDRSKSPIEPYLSKQWFIRMGDVSDGILCGRGTEKEFKAVGLAQAAIDATGRDYRSPTGRNLTFFPDHVRYGGTYRSWLEEKRDWCISRQLWWGHRIPIWHGSFERDAIPKVVAALPELTKDDLWTWIADSEGNLYSPDRISELPQTGLFDVLVCPRTEEARDACATDLEAAGLTQDPDVLDTWFSSALWPFSTLGWPDPETAKIDKGQRWLGAQPGSPDSLSYYYPGSCLITGRDIITLWVARMQIMGLYLLGDVPFTDCFIHATIQDGKGERMSKSKGNGIDPVDIIEKYGADAMRYVLCDMQTGTQDIRLPVQAVSPFTGELVDLATAEHGSTIFTYICPQTGKEFDVLGTMPDLPMAKIISERFDVGRAFCTKLWNAARFSLMNLGEHKFVGRVTAQLKEYNPSAAIGAARDFFWSELCDWYLEFIKPRFWDEASAPVVRSVLAYALDQVLRLFHPFVPFITEVLWEALGTQCAVRGLETPIETPKQLISASWPVPMKDHEDEGIEKDFRLIEDVIRSIRELRARYNIPPKTKLGALVKSDAETAAVMKRLEHLILHMGGLETLEVAPDMERPAAAAMQVVGSTEIYLTGLIDPQKERDRLQKQLEKLLKDIQKAESKLQNANFVERAPAHVVEEEKKRLSEAKNQVELIENNLAVLDGL